MNQRTRLSGSKRLHRGILCLGALLIVGAVSASAQGWQETIGSNNAAGETGVAAVEAANGDMLVAGYTGQPYIIRTDPYGTIVWHTIYPLIGFHGGGAAGIQEFPNGDLAVVGGATDANGFERVLVMRLTSAGFPVWITTLGDNNTSMAGRGLVITKFGSGAAQPGDIVVCGNAGLWSGPHGILARLDGNTGNLIWFKDYEVTIPGGTSSGELLGIDEAQIATGSNAGDIVATGFQGGVAGGTDFLSDIWVIRVDGTTGTSVGAGLGSATFATPGSDIGRGITELRYGANPGDLAVAGSSDGRPGAEIIMLQTLPDPTDPAGPRASSFVGTGGRDWANGICEITPGVGGNTGDMVVAGTTFSGTFGGADAFIQEIGEGTLNSVGPMHYMGGNNADEALSVSPVIHGPTSNGYIIAGYTQSADIMPPGNRRNVYLMKNFYTTLGNNCQNGTVGVSDFPAGLTPVVNTIVETNQVTASSEGSSPISPAWGGNQLCPPDSKFMAPGAELASIDAAVAITAHPSLVRRGDRFTLDYSLAAAGAVTTTISDVAGHVVSQSTLDRDAGTFSQLIRTDGWSSGTYLARVSVDGHVATSRIVVIDR